MASSLRLGPRCRVVLSETTHSRKQLATKGKAMPTNLSLLTYEQKRATQEIYRIFRSWTDEQLEQYTDVANSIFDETSKIAERASTQCGHSASIEAEYLEAAHDLTEDDVIALCDEVFEWQHKGGCAPLAGHAILAVIAKQWITSADYDALTAGWRKHVGPIPAGDTLPPIVEDEDHEALSPEFQRAMKALAAEQDAAEADYQQRARAKHHLPAREKVRLAFTSAQQRFLCRMGVNSPFTDATEGTWLYHHPEFGDTPIWDQATERAIELAVEQGLLGLCYRGSELERNGILTYYSPTADPESLEAFVSTVAG